MQMKELIKFGKSAAAFVVIIIILVLIINFVYTQSILPKKTFYRNEMIYRSYISNLSEKKIDYFP